MNNTEIKKILDYLDNGKIEEAKFMLKLEAIRSCDKKELIQVKLVEKYIKSAQKYTARPTLGTVMHQNGNQFICNGCSLVVFRKHNNNLDILPQTTEEYSLQYTQIMKPTEYRAKTEGELQTLLNLKKYIKFCTCEKIEPLVCLSNKVFNANLLYETIQMFNGKVEDIQIGTDENCWSPVYFRTEEIEALVLPLRASEEQKELAENTMLKFREYLEQL